MRSLLFVCTANICRSAYAELVASSRVGGRLAVGSAGTHGWTAHPVEAHMAAELQERGVEPAGFRSRRLTRPIIDDADVVLTAEAAHRTFVLQERPAAVRKTFSLGQLASALDEVPPETPAEQLLAAARRVRPTAHADEDVVDPYGRGAEAAATTAALIDGLLDRVLPRLTGPVDPT